MKEPNWMSVEMEKSPAVMIVDCGDLNEEGARDRADKIFAVGVGGSNLRWGPSTGQQRIHINIPKTKQASVLAQLPISDKKTWFGATHSYLED